MTSPFSRGCIVFSCAMGDLIRFLIYVISKDHSQWRNNTRRS
jgi:hypothetical protein